MRLVRFRFGDRIATGVVEGGAVRALAGTFFENPVPSGEEIPLDDVRLLAPILPSKVVCLGKNYAAHAAEFGGEVPEEPLVFLKPSTSVSGPGDPIPLPPISNRVDYEGELGVVIMTGTPEGVGKLEPGDKVEVAVDGIGVLMNPVGRRT